jgi:hypothetical protein
MVSRNPKHTPGRLATMKDQSPSQIASRVRSYRVQLTSFVVEELQVQECCAIFPFEGREYWTGGVQVFCTPPSLPPSGGESSTDGTRGTSLWLQTLCFGFLTGKPQRIANRLEHRPLMVRSQHEVPINEGGWFHNFSTDRGRRSTDR